MGRLHHAITGTGAVSAAAAAAVHGTTVAQVMGGGARSITRIGHPAGVVTTGAEAEHRGSVWTVSRTTLSRSARRLMAGEVYFDERVLPS